MGEHGFWQSAKDGGRAAADEKIKAHGEARDVVNRYSEIEKGFGKDFVGDKIYDLIVDLSSLEIIAEDGVMNVGLNYADTEILSVSTILSVESPETRVVSEVEENETAVEVGNETITSNETLQNETILNETNVNKTITEFENASKYALTDGEIFILKSNTGDSDVKITKAEVDDGRLVVRFQIGKFWKESSYDYSDKEKINSEVEIDRAKWLKNLAIKLGEKESSPEKVDGFVGNYSLS